MPPDSPPRWSPARPTALVVACSDGRLQVATDDLLLDDAHLSRWSQVRGLLLAVEVISPSSVHHDRVTKRAFFQRVGVPEYWVVDIDGRAIERWRPESHAPEILRERLEWRPAGSTTSLLLDPTAFFAKLA